MKRDPKRYKCFLLSDRFHQHIFCSSMNLDNTHSLGCMYPLPGTIHRPTREVINVNWFERDGELEYFSGPRYVYDRAAETSSSRGITTTRGVFCRSRSARNKHCGWCCQTRLPLQPCEFTHVKPPIIQHGDLSIGRNHQYHNSLLYG